MFDPAGEWTHLYRIESGGAAVGSLQLQRIPRTADTFALKIHQRVVDSSGRAHEIDAVADCRTDLLATVTAWKLASRFFAPSGEVIPSLTLAREGSEPDEATSDWSLFEALQRMEGDPPSQPFDLLEGLRIRRRDQRIWRRNRAAFLRPGSGNLPWEYELDGTHRIVRAATGERLYVLANGAETP